MWCASLWTSCHRVGADAAGTRGYGSRRETGVPRGAAAVKSAKDMSFRRSVPPGGRGRAGRREGRRGEGGRVGASEVAAVNVDGVRLRDLTLELVEVPSPTGDTADVARLYVRRLEEIGLEVELLDDVFPATPTVVGRLRGARPGPTVVLNGHLDTVPVPHEPPRLDRDRIYGRGSADMKGACAAAAEAARVLAGGGPFAGELVI